MKHVKNITRHEPARAESLLQWQQKAVVFGGLATGINTLASALNTFTQANERKGPDA